MARGRSPLFLERRGYRVRRLMDAVRFWPVIGLVLWMLPLLWPRADAPDPMPMSEALIYLFGVWIVLIAGSLLAWVLLRRAPQQTEPDPPRQDRG
ncbi:hypothetical protein R5H30_02565 [Sulfitobacter sp. D35]|uniref:hypothetical protein n=1 Tax=Sulfitobacter sp. D35 TaxID=3083252 RepID=UPI00296FEA0F|nr:hypothetical protein [Sulfitobacter sp. D35]MDW4496849.1 hypothetical protein [Sulfitobacter sp. D35]